MKNPHTVVQQKSLIALMVLISCLSTATAIAHSNALTRFEIYPTAEVAALSKKASPAQVIFDFQHQPSFKLDTSNQEGRLSITFHDVSLTDFTKHRVVEKLEGLDVVHQVQATSAAAGGTTLTIIFVGHHLGSAENGIVARLTPSLKDHLTQRLVLALYPHSIMRDLSKNTHGIRLAHNAVPEPPCIALDPGHGGCESGARGRHALAKKKMYEKDLTLDIARRTRDVLTQRGAHVVLTRNSDCRVTPAGRSACVIKHGADAFVSIHGNSAGRDEAKGVETYHFDQRLLADGADALSHSAEDAAVLAALHQRQQMEVGASRLLSQCVLDGILNHIRQRGVPIASRGVKHEGFCLLHQSQVNAVARSTVTPTSLVEVGFMTNPEEAERLASDTYKNYLAEGIANGIMKYIATTRSIR